MEMAFKRQKLTEPTFGLSAGIGRPRGQPLLANAGLGLRGELGIEGAESNRTNVIEGGRVLPEPPAPRTGTTAYYMAELAQEADLMGEHELRQALLQAELWAAELQEAAPRAAGFAAARTQRETLCRRRIVVRAARRAARSLASRRLAAPSVPAAPRRRERHDGERLGCPHRRKPRASAPDRTVRSSTSIARRGSSLRSTRNRGGTATRRAAARAL